MVNIPLPGLPDINVNLPDINLPDVNLPDVNLPDLPDFDLPDFDLPDLPTIPGTDIPNIPGIGLWPVVQDMDVERSFWEMVDKYDELIVKHRLPSPKLRPILDQFSLIDSNKFEQVALVWGKNDNEPGIPKTIGEGVAEKVDAACDAVNLRWTGEAAESFNRLMDELTEKVLKKYGAPAHQVGAALLKIAEEFRLNWFEIIGLVGGGIGLVIGILGIPGTAGTSLVIAIIGAILSVVTLVISMIASVVQRLDPVKDAIEELRNDVNNKIPKAPDARVPLPTGKWTPHNEDPYS